MFQVIEDLSSEGVVALRVEGRLFHDDYVELVPKLEQEIARHGALRCLVDLTGLAGFELRAVWDEVRFDLKHARDVSRCAVIGDRSWERWATLAARPIFYKAEVRFFTPDQRDEAVAWLREGLPPASGAASA